MQFIFNSKSSIRKNDWPSPTLFSGQSSTITSAKRLVSLLITLKFIMSYSTIYNSSTMKYFYIPEYQIEGICGALVELIGSCSYIFINTEAGCQFSYLMYKSCRIFEIVTIVLWPWKLRFGYNFIFHPLYLFS